MFYDFDWETTPDKLWNVTKIRGVKELFMTHNQFSLKQSQHIDLLQEEWYMDGHEALFIFGIFSILIITVVFQLYRAEWLCFKKRTNSFEADQGWCRRQVSRCF